VTPFFFSFFWSSKLYVERQSLVAQRELKRREFPFYVHFLPDLKWGKHLWLSWSIKLL